jgi:hypothetical protein
MHAALAFKTHYQKIKGLYFKYERVLMPASLVFGFFVDYFTFTNIDIASTLVIQCVYWGVVAGIILFIYAYDAGKITQRLRYIRLFSPLLFQFLFGGLLSGSFIFYWFSASIWVSWPLIVIFIVLMVSNDLYKHHFLKPLVQLSVFYFITFALLSLALPYIFRSISPWWFVMAGVAGLGFAIALIRTLARFSQDIRTQYVELGTLLALIFVSMNILYFTNLIPPIPLAVREASAYHKVQRQGNEYLLSGERESFWQRIIPGKTLRIASGERVYVFSSIFSPEDLNTVIIHEWQKYDEQMGEWTIADRLSFSLTGGRQEGFRGYSYKTTVMPGKWRVYIKTSRGQTLGRVRFNVERAYTSVELDEIIK